MAQDRLLSRRSRPSKHWSRPWFADFDDRNRTTMREPEREAAGRPPRPARTALLRRQDLFLGTGFGDSSWRHAAWSMKANSAPGSTARSWRPPNSELAGDAGARLRHELRQPREGGLLAVGSGRRPRRWWRAHGRVPRVTGPGRAPAGLFVSSDIE